jgi:uncharacterized protein YaaW (UPF0174 family)
MAKNDELDAVLCDPRMTEKDFGVLYEVLGIEKGVPYSERRVFFNTEIRHAYGHTAVNLFREWHDPDYSEIVRETAKKLKLSVKETNTLEETEDKILVEIIELARDKIFKEQGEQAWKDIEKAVDEEITRLISSGKIPAQFADEFSKLRGAALIAALISGRLAGFALFIVANQIFFAISRWLGLGIGVALAGPIIGRTLAALLGPAGWILSAVLVAFDLGNTNWKKVIPTTVMIITLRRRFKFGDDGESGLTLA